MVVRTEFERQDDGRWIAEVTNLPGVMAYGASRERALAAVQALALRVIADRIEHGEATPSEASDISFRADSQKL
jgi:predicted RNase H-like HicB family nuclease